MAIPAEAHTCYVYDRGGQTRVGMIDPVASVSWGRVTNDISAATVATLNPGAECCRMLGQVEPGRHELVVYRGRDRVWEGPIMRTEFGRDGVVLHADDVLRYTYRTILRAGYDDSSTPRPIEERARLILIGELARHEALTPPINVVPYLRTYALGQTRESRMIFPFQKTLYEELEDLGSDTGLRYATVGRRIVVWDRDDDRLGRTDRLADTDFAGNPVLSAYGMELGTFAAATDGEGHYGWVGAPDPYYGLWEHLETVWEEGEAAGEAPNRQVLQEQARLNLAGRNPTPTRLNMPAGASLDPRAPVTLDQLVPGVRVPVRAELACRTVVQEQVVHEMQVSEDSDGETITLTLTQVPNAGNLASLPRGGDLT